MKGGQIGHEQATGEWHSTDRHDHRHPIRDPFAQATSSHHALEAKLKEHPVIRRFYIRIGHGVVFPDSANPHRPLTPNAEPAIPYCGLSRARAHLVIVATEKTMETVGRASLGP